MRLWAIIMKELRAVREDPSFHLAALVSPLLFLLAFSLMLSSGIVLPLATYPDAGESAFLQGVADYRAPDGTPYLSLSPAAADVPRSDAENDLLVVRQEPQLENGVLSGELIHYVNDVNENMTKNYRNRVDGAVRQAIDALREDGGVTVREHTRYAEDIPWDTGFGVSVLVFSLMLSGLLFGMLAMTSEWSDRTTTLLRLAPASPRLLICGKLLAGLVKCVCAGAAFLAVFTLISGTLPVHVLAFAGVLLLVYASFLCLGMCLGLVIHSALTAFLISLVSALVLWVGGGGFGPLSYFGTVANILGALNPATYAIELVRWCYFDGAGALAFQSAALVFAAAVSLAVVLAVYSRWTRGEEGR